MTPPAAQALCARLSSRPYNLELGSSADLPIHVELAECHLPMQERNNTQFLNMLFHLHQQAMKEASHY